MSKAMVAAAAAIGALVGSLVSGIAAQAQPATSDRISTREILLVDERNRPARDSHRQTVILCCSCTIRIRP